MNLELFPVSGHTDIEYIEPCPFPITNISYL